MQPTFRSGAVARKADMPVATLRIWEQRYQAVGPTTSPSGHRQYSLADVERVTLLRQLTQRGHAISSLAALTLERLQELAATPPASTTIHSMPPRRAGAPFRIVVVGLAMVERLTRPYLIDQWDQPPQLVGAYESLEQATQAGAAAHTGVEADSAPIDLLLWHAASLQDGSVAQVQAARDAWRARSVAVAYRFSGSRTRDALVGAGFSIAREPADEGALVAWLSSFESSADGQSDVSDPYGPLIRTSPSSVIDPAWLDALVHGAMTHPLPRRQFDDSVLTKFAGLSSTVACECPSHVAELLMQIASFETYSASCSNLNAADAKLHHYLQRVAGTARVLFESALERVAAAEGFVLQR